MHHSTGAGTPRQRSNSSTNTPLPTGHSRHWLRALAGRRRRLAADALSQRPSLASLCLWASRRTVSYCRYRSRCTMSPCPCPLSMSMSMQSILSMCMSHVRNLGRSNAERIRKNERVTADTGLWGGFQPFPGPCQGPGSLTFGGSSDFAVRLLFRAPRLRAL